MIGRLNVSSMRSVQLSSVGWTQLEEQILFMRRRKISSRKKSMESDDEDADDVEEEAEVERTS